MDKNTRWTEIVPGRSFRRTDGATVTYSPVNGADKAWRCRGPNGEPNDKVIGVRAIQKVPLKYLTAEAAMKKADRLWPLPKGGTAP